MREAILMAVLIISVYCILNSLSRVNNNEELTMGKRSALVFLIFLIPVAGFILTRKMKKVDC
ncbi:MAG: hypothetical protein CFE25_00615 [Chitinophagaceae bacterium BSSC1]|nr:MAG: hypothetical protein CFE25_00615 [Chitinophagaceae bacterium BSSC1]